MTATAPAPPGACARAASAAESRFRIDRPIRPARAARVVALDPVAEGVARRVSAGPWAAASTIAAIVIASRSVQQRSVHGAVVKPSPG